MFLERFMKRYHRSAMQQGNEPAAGPEGHELMLRRMVKVQVVTIFILVVMCGTLAVVAYNSVLSQWQAIRFQAENNRLLCKLAHYVNAPPGDECQRYDFAGTPKITDPVDSKGKPIKTPGPRQP